MFGKTECQWLMPVILAPWKTEIGPAWAKKLMNPVSTGDGKGGKAGRSGVHLLSQLQSVL
jgi:hypothetical protein